MADPVKPAGPALPPGAIDQRPPEVPRLEHAYKIAFPHQVRVDEVGPAGIATPAALVNYLGMARVEYLRNLAVPMEGTAAPVQPVVHQLQLDVLGQARFDAQLLIRTRIATLGRSLCRFEYLIEEVEAGRRIVSAATTVICTELASFRPMPWPRVFSERVAIFEGETLQRVQ